MVTDGPFAETRESLGGFVTLETSDMAAAEAIAAEWPGVVKWGALDRAPADPGLRRSWRPGGSRRPGANHARRQQLADLRLRIAELREHLAGGGSPASGA